jgi:hypothetical protein
MEPLHVAGFSGRVVIAFCYGFVMGLWFALPVFESEQTFGDAEMDINVHALKLGSFALIVAVVCAIGFGIGRRKFKPYVHCGDKREM